MPRQTPAAALYVRPVDVSNKCAYSNLHLERLLWSYNRDFKVEWSVSHGWPKFRADTEGEGSCFFDVAFVDEDAVPDEMRRDGGVRASSLLAERIVWVSRSRNASAHIPVADKNALVLERPLSYDKFCAECAKLLAPSTTPFSGRFEYHTIDVLQDIWSEGGDARAGVGDTPAPLARYSLDAALDAKCSEALVVTRRQGGYALLYANGAFWDKVGWTRGSTIGQSLAFLQGPATQQDVLSQLHERLESEQMQQDALGEWVGTLVNYTQQGQPFTNRLSVTPCTDAALYIGRISVGDDSEEPGAPVTVEPVADHVAPRESSGFAADEAFAEAMSRVLLDTAENVVVTKAVPPFRIVHVNDAWCELCDFTPEEVIGKTLRTIQGPHTSDEVVAESMGRLLELKETVEMTLTNYKKGAVPFINRVEVEPICDSHGEVRYMVGRLHEEPDLAAQLPAAVLVD